MLHVVERTASHDEFVRHVLEQGFATRVVSRGKMHDPVLLPGFVAFLDDRPSGLVTYESSDTSCELVTLNALVENKGIGTALVDAVIAVARREGCSRLWLITTNDNLRAQTFYEHRGFRLVAVHKNALEASRRLKPEISLLGINGVPITDEFEYELPL